jgi:hypothetical protein
MARIFSGSFCSGQGKAREIKSKAGNRTVFIIIFRVILWERTPIGEIIP